MNTIRKTAKKIYNKFPGRTRRQREQMQNVARNNSKFVMFDAAKISDIHELITRKDYPDLTPRHTVFLINYQIEEENENKNDNEKIELHNPRKFKLKNSSRLGSMEYIDFNKLTEESRRRRANNDVKNLMIQNKNSFNMIKRQQQKINLPASNSVFNHIEGFLEKRGGKTRRTKKTRRTRRTKKTRKNKTRKV